MHKNQKVLFCSGFPRAGSSLLMNILAQNPIFFPTPTSGLISSVMNIKDSWKGNDVYKSNGEEYIYPKIRTMLKNMIIGFYQKEVLEGKIPIDKNRMWTSHIDFLDEIFNCNVKILFPIRSIGDCIISMEKVNRKSTVNNHGDNGNWLNERTTIGRAENFIKDNGIFGMPLLFLREIIYRNQLDRLIFVNYDDMLLYSNEIFKYIYDSLGIEYYQHDFNNIKQVIIEQDLHHGFAPNSLHKIKEGSLKLKPRDNTIFKPEYLDDIENNRFGDITGFIKSISINKK